MTEEGQDPKGESSPFDDLRRWMKVLAGGCCLAVVSLLIVVLVVYNLEKDQRQAEKVRDKQALLERATENCHTNNEGQTRERNFNREQIVNVITNIDPTPPTPEEVQAFRDSPGLKNYYDFIEESYPYRQCSPECVMAQLDPDTPNCAPASTEQG